MKIIFSSIWLVLFASFNLVVLFNTKADVSAFYFIITNLVFAVFLYVIYAFYYSNIKNSTLHKARALGVFFGIVTLYFMYKLTNAFIKNDLTVFVLDSGRGKFLSEILVELGEKYGILIPFSISMVFCSIILYGCYLSVFTKKDNQSRIDEL